MQTDLLLITPPFTQINTPYPATPMLKGTLSEYGFRVEQLDLGIETIQYIFTKEKLEEIFDIAESAPEEVISSSRQLQLILANRESYISSVESVILFLQNRETSIAQAICNGMLPTTEPFEEEDLEWKFGTSGLIDRAKYIATRFVEELAELITATVDPNFGFSRYAESISSRSAEAESLLSELDNDTIITDIYLSIIREEIEKRNPKTIGFTVPFPGNLLSAMRCAKQIKEEYPNIVTVMGGGFPNTEFRSITDTRLFQYIDYLILDDGEQPLIDLLNHTIKGGERLLKRTFTLQDGKVTYIDNSTKEDIPHSELGTPDYSNLHFENYISVLETANPMHRLWSDGVWNKMVLAHGCYWGNCSFCDTSLDYIKRYSPRSASSLCDQIETIIETTGCRGFHFTDEAAPPKLLKELAIELIKRGIKISWWTNIRFEKSFTKGVSKLLAKSGCIAISGGLEVASDRLLKLMNKGVTIEQVTTVTHNLKEAGILVHAYLMYGFPTETDQETIDSLEVVRQLFDSSLIKSAFWHRFAMTVHSPIGCNPEKFGVKRVDISSGEFALNDCDHIDPTGADHGLYSEGLRTALYNYIHNNCIEKEIQEWFSFTTLPPSISPTLISDIVDKQQFVFDELDSKKEVLWIGHNPRSISEQKKKTTLLVNGQKLQLKRDEASWLLDIAKRCSIKERETPVKVSDILKEYSATTGQVEDQLFCSKLWIAVRDNILLV